MYRIRLVKLKSRNILPMKPQAREAALRAMHQWGSGKPTEYESCPGYTGSKLFLHEVMRAAMDMTLARGPVVAARSGIAVEANHQSFPRSSSSGLIRNFHNCLTCPDAGWGGLYTLSIMECGVGEAAASAVPALLGGDFKPPITGFHELRRVQIWSSLLFPWDVGIWRNCGECLVGWWASAGFKRVWKTHGEMLWIADVLQPLGVGKAVAFETNLAAGTSAWIQILCILE